MAILNIIKNDDAALRRICKPIDEITPRIRTLAEDMIETMRAANGCGLAAPQVGILRRIVVVEIEEDSPYVLINPKIIESEGEQNECEGCLSLPGKWGITRRPYRVVVEATDLDGNLIQIEGEDLLARAFCHEIDHLDGKLYTDVVVREVSADELED